MKKIFSVKILNLLLLGIIAIALFSSGGKALAACSNSIIENGVDSPQSLASKLIGGNLPHCYQDSGTLQAAFRKIMTLFVGKEDAEIALNDMKAANDKIVGGYLYVDTENNNHYNHWLEIRDASGNPVRLSDGSTRWEVGNSGFGPVSFGRTTDGGYSYDITGGQGEHYYGGGVRTRFAENSTSWVYIHLAKTTDDDSRRTYNRDGVRYVPDFLVMKSCGNVIYTGLKARHKPKAEHISPANKGSFTYGANESGKVVTLKGRATDDRGHKVKVKFRWKKSSDSKWKESTRFVYLEFQPQPYTYSWNTPPLTEGTYYWQVIAKDKKGKTSGWTGSWTFTVKKSTSSVSPSPPPGSPSPGLPSQPSLTCSLKGEPVSGILPLTVKLTASVTPENISTPTYKYDWDFGDGSKEENSTKNPINHTYTTEGEKRATVTIRETTRKISCETSFSFTVNPWSSGDKREVAP